MTRREALAGIAAIPLLATAAAAGTPATLRSLALATGWLGERPSFAALQGRVVLLDIFTFECINCRNVTPALKRLYATYPRADLAIVAVHTPEVPSYQSRMRYVADEARAAALPWPIALDNEHRIWDAYGVSAWPTQLVFDRSGTLRTTVVGDGADERVAAAVRASLHGA